MRGEHFHFFLKKKTVKMALAPVFGVSRFLTVQSRRAAQSSKSSEMQAAAAARSVSARARPVFASATPVVSQTEPR